MFFSSTLIKRWFQPFGLHSRSLTISFVCNFLSSSAGFNLCSCFFPAHPCLLLSLPAFSGPSVPRPVAASLPLSDPRCFGFLSSASVLGSDYSASVLPFCSLHASASQWLSRCSLGPFVPQVFHLLSGLVSHPFLPVLLTWLRCSFPFALPCFAPTAVPQVLAFFPVPLVPLFPASFCSALLSFVRFRLPFSATQLSRSPVPLLPSPALRQLARCSFASFVAPVFLFLPPWFPMTSVRFRLLGSLPRSLSSFPVHLPQLTFRCWPCFPLRFFPFGFPLCFLFRPSSFLA